MVPDPIFYRQILERVQSSADIETHVWSCLNIRSVWNAVFNQISAYTGIITRTNVALTLVSVHADKFPPTVYSDLLS